MKKIWNKIKETFNKIVGKSFDFMRGNAKVAVDIVNVFKTIVESPATEFIIDLTPTTADDKIHDRLKIIVPQVAEKMLILEGIMTVGKTQSEVFAAIINHVRQKYPGTRGQFYTEFAAELNVALEDGEISNAEGKVLTQLVWLEFYDKIYRLKS